MKKIGPNFKKSRALLKILCTIAHGVVFSFCLNTFLGLFIGRKLLCFSQVHLGQTVTDEPKHDAWMQNSRLKKEWDLRFRRELTVFIKNSYPLLNPLCTIQ